MYLLQSPLPPQSPLIDTRPFPRRLLGAALGIPSAVLLAVSLLGLNLFQILSLVLLPFSRKSFRSFNRWCAGSWWGAAALLGERVHGYRLTFSGDELPSGENAIVIGNHQEMPDILVVLCLAFRKGRIGDLKWFAKDVLKWVPGVGWGMVFLDCIFLKRNWTDDRAPIEKTFEKYHRERIPFWLVMFPEGTRIRPAKLAQAQAFARARGYSVPEHVLLPKSRGFAAAVNGLGTHGDAMNEGATAIYDVTIGYVGGIPKISQLFTGAAPGAHVHVRRIPITTLPKDELEIAVWLRERFVEKDRLLKSFLETGHFL